MVFTRAAGPALSESAAPKGLFVKGNIEDAMLGGRDLSGWAQPPQGHVGGSFAEGIPTRACNAAVRITLDALRVDTAMVIRSRRMEGGRAALMVIASIRMSVPFRMYRPWRGIVHRRLQLGAESPR